ncbi:MAG TPA: hypothetical protein VMM60_00770 [Ilumatobacter sp.]|nr:hypothetical protein [Ilumatobacter sp.]
MQRSREAALVGVAGAVLASAAGAVVGLGIPAAVVGALNGAISGHRRIYEWRRPRGIVAFVLDSTWALPTTAAAVVSHGAGAVRGQPSFTPVLSERQNRHVYERGMVIRRGFAITYGNSVNGTGDTTVARRAKLVTDHEDVHVWQARWLGPLYPVLYGGWMLGGGAAGVPVWLWRRFVRRSDATLAKTIESCAYYLNPLEWWAYSRDDHWPPSGKVAGLGPATPIVPSFASLRRK